MRRASSGGLGSECTVWFASISRHHASYTRIQRNDFTLDSRQEPYEVILHVRICAGGRRQRRFLPQSRFTYETTAFQGWRLNIARGGKTFMRYFSDKQCGGPRKALKEAEAKLAELKAFLDSAPRRQGKLTKEAEGTGVNGSHVEPGNILERRHRTGRVVR